MTRLPALLAGIALFTLLAGCGAKDEAKPVAAASQPAEAAHEEAPLKLSPEELARAGIKVEALKAAPLADAVEVTATIQPDQDLFARIAAPVEGRIVSVAASLGANVRAGQTLAVLESVALGEASSALTAARAAQRIAEADFKRAEALQAEEIIAQKDYLRARAELDKAGAELRAAEDRVRVLGADPGSAGRSGARLAVSAPFAGTVVARKATVGELASPSEPLFAVADLSKLWIEANLTEPMLARVHQGAQAAVSVAAYPGERFEGRVTYVAGMLEKDSRTVVARIEVDNKDGRLKPEMFATARINAGTQVEREVLAVPDDAVVLLQGQPTVFVAKGEGFEPRPIDPGEKVGGRTVVKSGLVAGDSLVVSGAYALKARLLKSQISDEH
ncbi:efflux RND transporter periplasmic adaptor subunit [Niveibacterium sp. SC-1]|uniref:efflux RND transporter periplasmic adaptor subunit n=1 Tax=Niveibacterium sp. SC-1 TaxID=3135646 RepID=UPI00311D66A8